MLVWEMSQERFFQLGEYVNEERRAALREMWSCSSGPSERLVNGVVEVDIPVICISRPLLLGGRLRIEPLDVSRKHPLVLLAGMPLRFDPPAERCRIVWEPGAFATLIADDDPLPVLRRIADVVGMLDAVLDAEPTEGGYRTAPPTRISWRRAPCSSTFLEENREQGTRNHARGSP